MGHRSDIKPVNTLDTPQCFTCLQNFVVFHKVNCKIHIAWVAWLCLTVQFSVGGNYNSSFLHKSSLLQRLLISLDTATKQIIPVTTEQNCTQLIFQMNFPNTPDNNVTTSKVTRLWIFGCFYWEPRVSGELRASEHG